MAAATSDRNTKVRGPCRQTVIPLATGAIIPFRVMVAVAVPSVGAVNASDTATQLVMGISGQAVNQTTGDTELLIESWGQVCFNNSGNITPAHVGQKAYVVDNQTVGLSTDTTQSRIAGTIRKVNAEGVWVDQYNIPAA